jgi:hypothetical protein
MSEPLDNTLAELMEADPLSLTREMRAPIIEYYRSRRHMFFATGASAKAPKTAKAAASGLSLDLGELKL